MATTIGEIAVDIRAKFDKLQSDMDGAKGKVSRAAKDIKATADTIQGALVAVGVGAFAGYIKSSIDAAGALADLSQKTGISAKDLSALEYAAKMSGTTLEGVATGIKGLSKNMLEAADGTGDAADAFKALGISVKDSSGNLKSSNAVMLEVADKFAGMEDGATKSAMAMKIFGKSGVDLIPLLNEGAAGIEKLKQEAEDLGLVINDQTANAMESLGDKFDSVGMAGQGIARQIAANITPALTAIADAFLEGAKTGGILKGAIDFLGDAFRVLTSVGFVVVEAITRIGKTLGALGAAAVAFFSGEFGQAADIVKEHTQDMLKRNEAFSAKMGEVWTTEIKAQENVTRATGENTKAKGELSKAAEKAAQKIKDVIAKLQDEIKMLGMSSLEAEIYKKQKEAGVAATSAQGQEIARLVTQLRNEADAHKYAAQYIADREKYEQQLNDERDRSIQSVMGEIEQEQRRIQTLGLTKSEVAALTLAELEHNLELAKSKANNADEVLYLQQRIDKQKELIGVLKDGELADANIKAADDAKKAWDDTSKSIENALTDSLMRGFESGKGMVQSLKDYITNAFKSYIVKFGVQAIMGAFGMGGSGNAMANIFGGGGSGGGGGGGIMDMLSSGKSLWDMASGGFAAFGNGLASLWAQAGAGLYQAGATNIGYSMLSSTGTVASLGAYAGGIGAGMGIGNAISGQYSLGGNKNIATGIGTAIGAAVGGPLGAAIGGAIGGLVNRAFGRGPKEVKERGITGTFGGGDFSGQSYADWKQKGGWFRSDKKGTDLSALPTEVEQLLDQGSKALLTSVGDMATALGLNADGLMGISTKIKVKLTGDAKEDEAAITDALTQYEQALTAGFQDALAPFQRAGETLTQTMQRLVILDAFSQTINQFGGIFSTIAGSSIEARESMIQLAGGIDALIGKAQSFVQAYYSQDEQMGMAARAVLSSLEAAGISTATLTGKEEFRALVESMDVSSQTGREQLATLLDIAPQFAQVAAYMQEQGLTLEQLAGMSPEMAVLGELFATKQDATTAATETAAQQTVDSLNSVEAAVTSGSGAVVSAISEMSATVSAAVSSAISSAASQSAAAAAQVASSLATMEANARLAASAPQQ